MKKVWIGVGIACGALLLVVVIGLAALGFWAKGKAESLVAQGEQLKQEDRVAELNKKFEFKAPAKGLPVELTDARLREYLAVRASLTQIFKQYEEQAKKFDARNEKSGQNDVSFSEAMEAGGVVMDLMRDLRAKWLTELEGKRMSPREFHSITAAIFTSNVGAAMGQMHEQSRAALEMMRAEAQKQANDPNLTQEERDAAKETIKELDAQIAELPAKGAEPTEAVKIHTANARLIEKYKKQIEEDANMGLDALLPGYADEHGLGEALENIEMGEKPGDAQAQ